MISFYPGPSRVYKEIPKYVKQAYNEGMLSINHRSDEFMALSAETIDLFKKKLFIPEDYTVFFTSSATECWEIIAQSLISTTSFHFYNGAFGKKWFDYTKKIHAGCIGYQFNINDELRINDMDLSSETGLICLTHNETSNGTKISNKRMGKIRKSYPKHLIAVDATSSMGGVKLNFESADVWFASVQKCFGLPAGMALMVCSPTAIKKALEINENNHYNSLPFMIDKMKNHQTTHTPNVLSIYLLNKIMNQIKPVDKIEKKLKSRLKMYRQLIGEFNEIEFLVKNKKVQSTTVLPLVGNPKRIGELKKTARNHGILLGNGYGEFKENTFRIANFPAILNKEVKALHDHLADHIS